MRKTVAPLLALSLLVPIAVGTAEPASGVAHSWTISPGANHPAVPETALRGISCTSATNCVAVGDWGEIFSVATHGLEEQWNGKTWSIMARSKTSSVIASAVTCVTTTNCIAVGNGAERWNGKTWSTIAMPKPTLATSMTFYGVSCLVAKFCFAVGAAYNGQAFRPLIEHWNGKTWSIIANPNLTNSFLRGVSCSGSTDCLAVGARQVLSGLTVVDQSALTEKWNGKKWYVINLGKPKPFSHLDGVSCYGGGCVAVGSTGVPSQPLIEQRSNFNTYSITALPTQGSLSAVSCGAGCSAVGITPGLQTLVEHLDGTTWSIEPSEQPPFMAGFLSGVSCAGVCITVGNTDDSVTRAALVEQRR